mgnify:CR=1 FL=1
MAENVIARAPVTCEVAGRSYALEPTIRRCVDLCNTFDGALPAMRSLANGNFVTVATVIRIGAGLKLDSDKWDAFLAEVRDETARKDTEIFNACSDFVSMVFNGGRPSSDGDGQGDASGN